MTATMSSTMINPREMEWASFLSSLAAWELHSLTKDAGELVAHDSFVDGHISLDDIRVMLATPAGFLPPQED